MADELDPSEDERITELSTVHAIYPELVLDSTAPFTASLDIAVAPASPLPVLFAPLVASAHPPPAPHDPLKADLAKGHLPTVQEHQVRMLSYLPPLALHVALPDGYPAQEPPHVALESSWLPECKLEELKGHARTVWEDAGHDQVLYAYIDYLQQAAEDGFGLVGEGDSPLFLLSDLELGLLDFDLAQKRAKFEQETFVCGVCLEPKKGKVCHRLALCAHVFCVECLQDFYNNCITEGDVVNVRCLAPDCGRGPRTTARKKRRKNVDCSLTPSELLQIPLEQEMVQRYVKMKKKRELESDKNTIYCPRKWCQGAARPNKKPDGKEEAEADDSDKENEDATDKTAEDSEDEELKNGHVTVKLPPPSERLAICSDCSFAFCSVCRQGWHGELIACLPPRKKGELTEEERLSEMYLSLHSTPCPTCDARCQKSHGCNHMLCYNCETHFCYLCSAWLDQGNPYVHFNTKGTACYQRLWELEEGDDDRTQRGPLAVQPAAAAPAIAINDLVLNDEGDEVNGEVHPAAAERAAPPPAPVPPAPPAGAAGPPWVHEGVRFNGRAARGLVRRAPLPNAANAQNGLQRFLAMAQNDEEDDWDSDELDDEDEEEWDFRPARR